MNTGIGHMSCVTLNSAHHSGILLNLILKSKMINRLKNFDSGRRATAWYHNVRVGRFKHFEDFKINDVRIKKIGKEQLILHKNTQSLKIRKLENIYNEKINTC